MTDALVATRGRATALFLAAGHQRSEATVLAVLLTSEEPLSLERISEEARVSRSTAMSAIRILASTGAVARDAGRAPDRTWVATPEALLAPLEHARRCARLLETLASGDSDEIAPSVRARLERGRLLAEVLLCALDVANARVRSEGTER